MNNYYRNKKLTDSARHEACICHGRTDTTVWAHSNLMRHGKGRGLKAHDLFGAYLCFESHHDFDTMSNEKFLEKYSNHKVKWFLDKWEESMIVACEKGYLK